VRVEKAYVPHGKRNATVFWVGYSPAQINRSEMYASVGETRKYFLETLDPQWPFQLKISKGV